MRTVAFNSLCSERFSSNGGVELQILKNIHNFHKNRAPWERQDRPLIIILYIFIFFDLVKESCKLKLLKGIKETGQILEDYSELKTL